MVSVNHEPRPQPLKGAAPMREGEDELLAILNLEGSQDEPQHDSFGTVDCNNMSAGDAPFAAPSLSDNALSSASVVTQRASDASNSASSNQASGERGSIITPHGISPAPPVPPSNGGTSSIELLPSSFTPTSNSANDAATGSGNVPVDNSASELEFDDPSPPPPVTRATSVTSQSLRQGDVALAVAERVASRSTSFGDFGDDVEDQIEDRAIQIARRVLNEIRMETVDAHEVTTVPAGDASATIATELIDQQSLPQPETHSNKEVSTSVQRRRVQILLGLVALLVIVVIVLVVILVTRDNTSSNAALASSVQTSAPTPAPKCSFCAGGGSSTYSFEDLRKIPVGSNPTFPTCGDIYLYQQTLSSTDSSCPVLQALAFFFYCGCQTVPPRPKNATCTACPNGGIATGSLFCPKVDTVVTVVGSSLFYFENCAQLASTELQKYGCVCPPNNSTTSK